MTGGIGHNAGTGHSQPSKVAAKKTNVVAAAAVTATASGTNNNQIKVAARETAVVMAVAMAMAVCDGDGEGVDNGDNDSGIDNGNNDNGGVILVDGLVKNIQQSALSDDGRGGGTIVARHRRHRQR